MTHYLECKLVKMYQKNLLRKKIKAEIENFVEQGESIRLCQKLQKLPLWQKSKKIMLYAAIKGEVNVFSLMSNYFKKFYFPKIKQNNLKIYEVKNIKYLKSGPFGILEPSKNCQEINPQDLDLIIVPGLAFDLSGNRLGRGKGFYDRFLNKYPNIITVSLAFPFQIQNKIPTKKHDISIKQIISLKS